MNEEEAHGLKDKYWQTSSIEKNHNSKESILLRDKSGWEKRLDNANQHLLKTLVFPLNRWENWGSKRISNLPEFYAHTHIIEKHNFTQY